MTETADCANFTAGEGAGVIAQWSENRQLRLGALGVGGWGCGRLGVWEAGGVGGWECGRLGVWEAGSYKAYKRCKG